MIYSQVNCGTCFGGFCYISDWHKAFRFNSEKTNDWLFSSLCSHFGYTNCKHVIWRFLYVRHEILLASTYFVVKSKPSWNVHCYIMCHMNVTQYQEWILSRKYFVLLRKMKKWFFLLMLGCFSCRIFGIFIKLFRTILLILTVIFGTTQPTGILVPRGGAPFGQLRESQPLARSNFFSTLSQSNLPYLTVSMHRVMASLWTCADFRCWSWTFLEVAILGAEQKEPNEPARSFLALKQADWI